MREAGAGLAARTRHAVALADAHAMRCQSWRKAVLMTRDAPGQAGDLARRGAGTTDGTRRQQQPNDPDGAAMRVAAAGGSKHVALAFAADQGELLAQCLVRLPAGSQRRHFQERTMQSAGGTQQPPEIEIAMCAWTTLIDQRRLGS